MKAISSWKKQLYDHYFISKSYGVRLYLRDCVALFLMRFGCPYVKGGERDYGFLLNAVDKLLSSNAFERKQALEYLGLPKDIILIKDRRK